MKKVIGIISYLPDNDEVRVHRRELLINLIHKCNYLFNLPIHIICQNYRAYDLEEFKEFSNVTVSEYFSKLGITGARRELRKWFLESDCTNLIMLDDDCTIDGTFDSAQKYLKQIEDNPDCFIEFNTTLLKLFEISKELLSQVDFPDMEAENGDGFEDRVFVSTLRKKFPDKMRMFIHHGLKEQSISTKDKYSTWYKDQDLSDMRNKTDKIIAKLNE